MSDDNNTSDFRQTDNSAQSCAHCQHVVYHQGTPPDHGDPYITCGKGVFTGWYELYEADEYVCLRFKARKDSPR